eukprot:m.152354 g.152354  ORF g.152354 m.152354 type:complete len:69 (+) comp16353_c1_seq1:455-661(+)
MANMASHAYHGNERIPAILSGSRAAMAVLYHLISAAFSPLNELNEKEGRWRSCWQWTVSRWYYLSTAT